MLFSQRYGYKPVKDVFQVDSMDNDLRNGLWTSLFSHLLHYGDDKSYDTFVLLRTLWLDYFKKPVDKIPKGVPLLIHQLRDYFFSCSWFEVYDVLEFLGKRHQDEKVVKTFVDSCNVILEQEVSAYRFIGGTIARITSNEEISAIEEAINAPLEYIKQHLKRALDLLSNKTAPDYRNSVKESISAVESICKRIVGDDTTTLGAALKTIEKSGKVELNSNMRDAFKQLYWYTSDSAGIRHAIKDSSTVSFEDAKFMLVTCSAFVNYLVAQAEKSGVKL